MKKVFLGVGHGGSDPGAIGLKGIKEKDLNLSVALAIRDELERHDIMILMSRISDEDDPLADEVAECNRFVPDIAIDIHHNAGGGDGFEVYNQTNSFEKSSYNLARNIETEVIKLGQNSRGIKQKLNDNKTDWFGFIRLCKCPAVLAEFAFVDTKDVSIVDTKEKQKIMGVAAAKGILKTLGIEWKAYPQNDKWDILVETFPNEQWADEILRYIKNHPTKPYCIKRKKY